MPHDQDTTPGAEPRNLLRLGFLLVVLSAVATLALAGVAVAATPGEAPSELRRLEDAGVRELIIRRADALDAADRRALRERVDGTLVGTLPAPGVEVLRVPAERLDEAAATLRADPRVRWVEANSPVRAAAADPTYLWAHGNDGRAVGGLTGVPDADADIAPAWDRSTGARVTVAVVDSGVDTTHPDLEAQLATNPGETGDGRESNGVDDDRNGRVDDWRGWDFVGGDADPSDEHGHGTHVAGILGATRDNGIGVAGAAPDARVLPLRALDAWGAGWDTDVAAAFAYAGRLGVRVVNASLGGEGASPAQEAVIRAFPDTLFVVAAGNDGQDLGDRDYGPCTISAPNVLCVGASDHRDQVANFSNRGATAVDLFAPGYRVVSTVPGAWYGSMSGTSMATPQVAGVAALVLAADPALGTAAVRAALTDGADRAPAFAGVSVTGGRLSATGALAMAGAAPAAAPQPAPEPTPAPTAPVTPAPGPPPTATPAPTPTSAPPVIAPKSALVGARATVRRRRLTVRVQLRAATRVRVLLRATRVTSARRQRSGRRARPLMVTRRLPARVTRMRLATRLAPGAYRLTVAAGDRAVTRRLVVR